MIFIIVLIIGAVVGYVAHGVYVSNQKHGAKEKAAVIVEKIKAQEEEMKKEAKSEVKNRKKALEKELEEQDKYYHERLAAIEKREDAMKFRQEAVTKRQDAVKKAKKEMEVLEHEVSQGNRKSIDALLDKTKLSFEKAQKEVFDELEKELEQEKDVRVRMSAELLEESAEDEAENIITGTIQRYTTANAQRVRFEPIPISRKQWEGQQEVLELISEISQVELDYNEEQEAVYVMHFNLVRRAIAHDALQNIIKKKAFSEGAIKQQLKIASEKVHASMLDFGRKAFRKIGIPEDKYPEELMKLTGRMHYRTSYGQNILQHSLEVAFFSGMLAGELGADIEMSMEAGLFHDIGKAIDQEREEPHDLLTKEILEEAGADPEMIFTAYNHHDREDRHTVESRIVQAADAFSGARPAARAETSEDLAKRIDMLESKVAEIEGVRKSYVIQGGRELRTYFDVNKINDKKMAELVHKLAGKIEEEGGYPGQIMVHGIRELKVVEKAKGKIKIDKRQ